jgi:hypothetical protein
MCDGGYTKQGLNYIMNTGIEKEGDFDYPWYTNWGFAKPSKRRCTQKLDTRYKLGASDMNGDTWDNLPLSEGRATENMRDTRFTEPQGTSQGKPTITRTELVKEVIYANGPAFPWTSSIHSRSTARLAGTTGETRARGSSTRTTPRRPVATKS